MNHRRYFLNHSLRRAAGVSLLPLTPWAMAAQESPRLRHASGRPFRILMITFRGETDVDRGFRNYLSEAGLEAQITVRDVQQDVAQVPEILQEATQLRPDLIYVWGTPITLAVVGTYDAADGTGFIRDIPVVFALVAAPLQSRIVARLDAPGRNVTGAVHVVPTDVQLRAMQSYRPFQKMGVLYNGAEQNSRAIVGQAR
ncbi:MAG: hypothetical protein K2Q11_06270 [Burkholderiaceae bacterium]|nr:hypothetical protein [Burkholderiaceae bacterium]